MKDYPSISSTPVHGIHLWAFAKIDGSQIRAEWSAKRGFYKLGSRKQLITDNCFLSVAAQCLEGILGDHLAHAFSRWKWDRAICFFELVGPNSFAGSHEPGESLSLVLFDVAQPTKKGEAQLLPPKDFLDRFEGEEHIPTPELVFRGVFDEDTEETIRASTTLCEGVVCKYVHKGEVVMFKVKTRAWVEKVKSLYEDNPRKLKELL